MMRELTKLTETKMTRESNTGIARLGLLRLLPLAVAVLAVVLSFGGCSVKKAAFDSGLPGIRTGMAVEAVSPRGPYLEAKLELESRDLEAYVISSDECRAVFQVSETVDHVASGPQGLYRRGEQECQGVGIGNLEFWRDQNRRTAKAGIPRAQATYRVLYSDHEVALLRGNFPLAGYLGFTGVSDVVAVVPQSPECQGPIESGVASMEYRGKGKRALVLLGGDTPCHMRGLIQPPSQSIPEK
jgi:hypothetical protein